MALQRRPSRESQSVAKFVVDFASLGREPAPDGRLDGPAFHRNHEPIWSAIGGFLEGAEGDLLELGSGTGQHAMTFAARTPNLTWWPSDISPTHLASIAAWRAEARLENLRAPQRIDLARADWTWHGDTNAGAPLAAMLCINVLHISPWRVSQHLFAGAGRFLRPGGRLFLYGPFKRDGVHTAPSNADFDASLRARNPEWGVRDIGDLDGLAQAAGLAAAESSVMPSNNFVLSFTRHS
jgi:SAM-dependent methyltransferase